VKRKRRRPVADAARPAEVFVRGFVAAALLSALQDRAAGPTPPDWRKVLRHGLQGGAALTAGTLSAQAVARRDYATGAAAVLAGAAAVMAVETTLNFPSFLQENPLGQEEA
jgi:hypothetical protein